jgi:hypothetical protein
LRKPTLAAWAVNQLARQNRRDVDLLLDSGKRLLDAQRTSLEGGGRDQLDTARANLEGAVDRLAASARALLGASASEATLGRVEETLRAAALSPDGRPLLASGTLTKELQETGWGLLSGLAPEEPTPRRGAAQRDAEKERRKAARDELRAARERRTELARSLREARREEEKTLRELERARAEIQAIEAELAEVDATIERAGES